MKESRRIEKSNSDSRGGRARRILILLAALLISVAAFIGIQAAMGAFAGPKKPDVPVTGIEGDNTSIVFGPDSTQKGA